MALYGSIETDIRLCSIVRKPVSPTYLLPPMALLTRILQKMRGILLAAAATAASAAIAADKVTSLPGWSGALLSDFYSGYLNIPGGKHLHYIFTASTGNPQTDPVTVWFNGGPGCSSMEGFLNENGLYHITPGTNNLYANPCASRLYLYHL